jgi:hypothetical protein
MVFSEVAGRITERRAELDVLEEQLVGQLAEVRAERDELAVAEKVLARFDRQAAPAPPVSSPVSAQVAGRAVLLVPHRVAGMEDTALPADYQRILALVRAAGEPVATRKVGEGLGMDTEVRGKLEPLRGKLSKLADRGWLRKLPDGRFTVLF